MIADPKYMGMLKARKEALMSAIDSTLKSIHWIDPSGLGDVSLYSELQRHTAALRVVEYLLGEFA